MYFPLGSSKKLKLSFTISVAWDNRYSCSYRYPCRPLMPHGYCCPLVIIIIIIIVTVKRRVYVFLCSTSLGMLGPTYCFFR